MDHIGTAVEGELIPFTQLLAPHGADFTVDFHRAVQNDLLCLTAGVDDVRKLHSILQLDKFRGDHHRNGIILFLNCYFHKK